MYNEFIGTVEYKAPKFYINQQRQIKKTSKWWGQGYGWDEIEVIGNIFEDPELINS
jgi:hypothetical protein